MTGTARGEGPACAADKRINWAWRAGWAQSAATLAGECAESWGDLPDRETTRLREAHALLQSVADGLADLADTRTDTEAERAETPRDRRTDMVSAEATVVPPAGTGDEWLAGFKAGWSACLAATTPDPATPVLTQRPEIVGRSSNR